MIVQMENLDSLEDDVEDFKQDDIDEFRACKKL